MSKRTLRVAVLALAIAGGVVSSSRAAVSLSFNDQDATPTAGVVSPGGTVAPHVILNLSAPNDTSSGIDYRLSINTGGSGQFRILSRTANTAVFTPALADSNPAVAPVTLSPTSGAASLGGDRNGGADLTGINTYDTATFNIQALASTAPGVYTLSFFNASNTGGGPSFPTNSFAALGTYTITVVPEPASGLAVGAFVLAGLRRRRSCGTTDA